VAGDAAGGAQGAGGEAGLSGVAETVLFPVYARALEFSRPDALVRDEVAARMFAERRADFAGVERVRMDEGDMAAILMRSRELDRITGAFLARHGHAVVVHIGCGLDARYDRVAGAGGGGVDWFDLDLPEVVTLRRQWLGDPRGRYHLLAGSVLDAGWRAEVAEVADVGRPILFVAEGVLAYFEAAAVRGLVGSLRDRFPGSELAFDAFSPFTVHVSNLRLRLSRSGVRAHYGFGLRRGEDVERWADGIRLLDQWHPFDRPEPRLARYGWVRHVPYLSRPIGVYHYRLGTPIPAA